ncbi:cytochrome c maturation protein CcmE [Wolbachia endosymbiont of Brugia malayi]|uniref:Cytochrome c-type biogenesis protein CcmE n=1 Tax=Wolbachia sp. subsp. Brugia malayi (strain TRS) TaxID=292805 RepID=CCME_WOLTR|nr:MULTISPECIES: cytochrome c maturation protein CcmE [unclassified Wolbachia]Q5GS17.1 RecName: Full=Cytochrome c-type biogenesis protein CcmE; AltName: Full=Cytochrome c maturation protein E; AltName: Full=Heme chaperone CcmE [Wolbachia endosymbiont strain TRS of Brugia malayi]AAW71207.1 Cytochrome c-type biogenesis protein CcmE [Wolbachia endosymbiont strain TRS of Brugia malayi]QCB61403.1 cytochrome c maturation protein CcmE [Wolbachia endosymbiont of Brugia malayi]QIT36288.1 ccmE family pro
MKKKHKRLLVASGIFFFLNCIVFFILTILRENISFFYTVSEAITLSNNQKPIRIGGMVVEDSVIRSESEVVFQMTDFNKSIVIKYQGILPPMFSEKSGVVVQGKMFDGNTFLAETVFAKHDENYMPRK